ncbi:DUF4365 domain-containing protein [Streptomyces erythrochromogenes]|uniref:DUF4365 domain-containing protein n=1 Tax=Streptomyces erythrochromogenes TaxID=285574 RepID=UPI0036B967BA
MGEETIRRTGAPSSSQKEVASRAVLELIVNAAGCFLSDPRIDYNCVDATVVSAEPHPYALPRFDVQLKASSSKLLVRQRANGDFSMQLDARSHGELRRPRLTPVKLVLLLLPTGVEVPRLICAGDKLILDGIMLQSDPRSWDPLAPGQKSGTVHFKREDEFTEEYVRSEMKRLGDGGVG